MIAMMVVGIELLNAAVDIANLVLARDLARVRELATRAALGASRGRLVRQLASEGTLTVILDGVLGDLLLRIVDGRADSSDGVVSTRVTISRRTIIS